MARKGVFFGAYGPHQLKEDLKLLAGGGHRTFSQELVMRLTYSVYGTSTVPPGGLKALESPARSSELSSKKRGKLWRPPLFCDTPFLPVGTMPQSIAVEYSENPGSSLSALEPAVHDPLEES